MNSLFVFISTVLLFISCKSIFDEKLTLPRRDYTGNELRIDGYYHVSRQENHSAVYFLYRNGIVLFVGGYSDRFEEKMVNFKSKSKSDWGVFIVDGNIIQYEKWVGSSNIRACISKYTGHIVNDTTIRFTEYYYSETKNTFSIDEIWHFKQFANKPDSTNKFIK